jgi:hypothetical protein
MSDENRMDLIDLVNSYNAANNDIRQCRYDDQSIQDAMRVAVDALDALSKAAQIEVAERTIERAHGEIDRMTKLIRVLQGGAQ